MSTIWQFYAGKCIFFFCHCLTNEQCTQAAHKRTLAPIYKLFCQIPVIVIYRISRRMINNILFTNKMGEFKIGESLWQEVILLQKRTPTSFHAFQKWFDIKKLELEKLTLKEVREKSLEWREKKNANTAKNYKHWLENQYRVFMWLMICLIDNGHHPDSYDHFQWEEIGHLFVKEGKVCKYFYLCSKKQSSPAWTTRDDQIILQQMTQSEGAKKWTQIGVILFEESNQAKVHKPKAIRERWFSRLNPAIKKASWSIEQDLLLFELIGELGKRWSKIAKQFGNRNEHTIKNRYHQMVVRKLAKIKQSNPQMSEERLVQKIVSSLKEKKSKQIGTEMKMEPIKQEIFEHSHFSERTEMKVQESEASSEIKPNAFIPIVLKLGNFEV